MKPRDQWPPKKLADALAQGWCHYEGTRIICRHGRDYAGCGECWNGVPYDR